MMRTKTGAVVYACRPTIGSMHHMVNMQARLDRLLLWAGLMDC